MTLMSDKVPRSLTERSSHTRNSVVSGSSFASLTSGINNDGQRQRETRTTMARIQRSLGLYWYCLLLTCMIFSVSVASNISHDNEDDILGRSAKNQLLEAGICIHSLSRGHYCREDARYMPMPDDSNTLSMVCT
jgi:hypothetical protein